MINLVSTKQPTISSMQTRTLLLIFWVICSRVNITIAQEVNHEFSQLTINQGLSDTDATCITQDQKGFIWIGTYFGLNRYDGYEVTSFYNQNNPLRNGYVNQINDFCIDDKGRIWLATQGGITCFDSTTESFLELEVKAPAILNTSVTNIGFDEASEKIIVGNSNGITFFQLVNKMLVPQIVDSVANIGSVNSLIKGENNWWGASSKGLYEIHLNRKSISIEKIALPTKEEQKNQNISGRITAKEERWWTTLVKVFYCLAFLAILAGIVYYLRRRYQLKKAHEHISLEAEQAKKLHQMRLQFFTNISHEFKTPLTLILHPLEQLIKGEVNKQKQHGYYQIMKTNANRLLRLVNELLDFRKIESGVYALHAEKTDLSTFAESIYENFREHALLRDIDFSFHAEGAVDNLWMDKHIVEKILINLIVNAFQYTKIGGKIELAVYEKNSKRKPVFSHSLSIDHEYKAKAYVWIKIENSGVGIPASILPTIFDQYARTKEFSYDEKSGTGVGLALVKSMVARHSGLLQVFSQEGKGTVFLVGLPKGKAHLQSKELVANTVYKKAAYDLPKPNELYPENHQESTNKTIHETRKSIILIVEDNLGLRHFLREHFEPTYHLLEANNGKEALAILKNQQPDIILCDVMMPQMDGIELCGIVKNDPTFNHIPFILLTAKNAVENRIAGRQSGADVYLAKPFNMDELQLTLKNILASRIKLRALYLKNAFSEARAITVIAKEKDFIDKMVRIIENNMENNDFDIDTLCKKMGMSRTKLYNKIKTVTGKSVGEFIRGMRLRKAAELLASQDISIIQVMHQVGIQSQSYFTKSFKKEFGKTPSKYVKDL